VYQHPPVPQPGGWRPPADPADLPPAITRYALTPGRQAAVDIARFVAQVFLISTFVLFCLRPLATWLPGVTTTFLGVAAVILTIHGLLKLIFGDRANDLRVFTVVAIASWVVWLILPTAANPSPWAFVEGITTLVALVCAGFLAQGMDGVSRRLDWRGTLALAGTAVVLLVIARVPLGYPAIRMSMLVAVLANAGFGLAVTLTYAGYVLANPSHSRATMDEATSFWQRVMRQQCWDQVSPVATCVVTSVLGIFLFTAGMSDSVGVSAQTSAEALPVERRAPAAEMWLGVLAVCLLMLVVMFVDYLRVGWRALVVWLLYDGPPAPGVYRPHGWLASVRCRQLAFAGMLFANVLALRVLCGVGDLLVIRQVLGAGLKTTGAEAVPDEMAWVRAIFYGLCFVLPLVLPLLFVFGLYGISMKPLHDRVEETAPESPYAADAGEAHS
jgi:hypothetical protein